MGVCVFVTQQNIATAYAATAVTIMVSSNSADTILAGNLVLLSSAANRKHALNLGAHKEILEYCHNLCIQVCAGKL